MKKQILKELRRPMNIVEARSLAMIITLIVMFLLWLTGVVHAQYAMLPPAAPPPPEPMGWVFTRYTVCPEPRVCPIVFVSVGADGLNVRDVPDGYPTAALVNGTPLLVLQRVGAWTLVAPACDLTPTFLWSWTADVPLLRCWVY